uniref:phage tail tip lysozyme n=1 Tax=Methylobacterium sp. B34 TaxID=95563 RepID=UPI00034A1997|nr:phage tail tip lysozyme [Methylobacterium sp. B34]
MADFDYTSYDFSQPGAIANATYDRLLSLGIPKNTAAGAVGSLMGESGTKLNTQALNQGDGADGSDSIGMGQWNQDRAANLLSRAQQMGTSWHDPRAQIEHMAGELTGSHKHVLNALLKAPDAVDSGNSIWTSKYEVAGTPHLDRRLQNGLSFAQSVAGRAAPGTPADPETTGGTVDPWSPQAREMNPSTARLPVPALSPQFQQGQQNPGQGAVVGQDGSVSLAPNRMLVGSNELQGRGPQVANVVPRLPGETQDPQNITNPAQVGSSVGGPAFGAVFGQTPGPTPNPRFSTDPAPPSVAGRPTAYASTPPQTGPQVGPQVIAQGVPTVGAPDGARPAGAMSPSFFSDAQGNFAGISGISDLGKRLEKVGGWLNPQGAQGMAAASGAQTAAKNADTNEMSAKNNVDISQRSMKLKEAPSPNAFNSDNGKYRIIETTDPRTGQVTRTRVAIPEDEQDAAKSQFKPSATVEKMLAQDEDLSQKNMAILNDASTFRNMIRNGQVDMSLLGQTEANLRAAAGQGDEKALNALKLRAFIQQAANNQLRSEKGVQTDSDAKRIQDEILNGGARYNNKAIYDWMGKHMEALRDDVQYRSRRAQTAIKRYGPGYDPDNYMSQDWAQRGTSAQSVYDNDRAAPAYTGAAPAAAQAPGHIDPVIAAYRRRMGQ